MKKKYLLILSFAMFVLGGWVLVYSQVMRMMRFLAIFLLILLLPFSQNIYADTVTPVDQLSPSIISTSEASIDTRSKWVLSIMKPETFDRENAKFKPYDILGITALKGCGITDYPAYMSKVLENGIVHNDVYEPEMFSLPPLVRYLYQFGHCLTEDQKTNISLLLSRKQRLFGHGTINHAILQSASWYLLAQYFPGLTWHDIDDKLWSSAELMASHKSLLLRRSQHFMQNGQYELLSPTYAMVNFFPILNLIDFAQDIEVKKSAELEAILQLSALKVNSFYGVIAPPLTRKNSPQKNTATINKIQSEIQDVSISQQVLWYYYGIPSIAVNDLEGRRDPVYVVMLALSKWRPPEAVLKLLENNTTPYVIKMVTPTFGIWDAETSPEIYGKAYITKNFAIGAGTTIFNPSWYNENTQLFSILYQSKAEKNQIDCYQPYWKSNLGEDAWSTDRSSPFMQVYLGKTEGVILFNIPSKDPWVFDLDNRFFKLRNEHQNALYQLAQCRIPNSVDELIQEKNWVFAKAGDTFIAMGTLLGTNDYQDTTNKPNIADYKVFKIRQPKTAIYFKVAEKSQIMDFKQFMTITKNKALFFAPEQVKATYLDEDNNILEAQFQLDIKTKTDRVAGLPKISINGIIQTPSSSPVIDSPFMVLDQGHLKIKSGNALLDYSSPAGLHSP